MPWRRVERVGHVGCDLERRARAMRILWSIGVPTCGGAEREGREESRGGGRAEIVERM